MKFITCASYYGVGSSAITDLFAEYQQVFDFTNEEFRFVQDPDGISDLEYNLVENFNRHNSGHALKRFKKLVDFYNGNILSPKHRKLLGDSWKNISYKYIEALTDFKFHGYWMYDLYDKGSFYHFRKRILNKILKMTIWRNQPDRQLNTMKDTITLCSAPSEEKFLRLTKTYIEELFCSVCPKDKIAMVDQILPPTNIKRYLRYFDDIKVIVVDRDPRDVWVLEKYVWKDGVIPHEDVETFCMWFKYTRKHRKTENLHIDNITFVQFEDLIFHYDETVSKLEKWMGFSSIDHIRPRTRLNPDKSVKNTQTWLRVNNVPIEEINYIENELNQYLYTDFPKMSEMVLGKPSEN